jgi:hypothetical protein
MSDFLAKFSLFELIYVGVGIDVLEVVFVGGFADVAGTRFADWFRLELHLTLDTSSSLSWKSSRLRFSNF